MPDKEKEQHIYQFFLDETIQSQMDAVAAYIESLVPQGEVLFPDTVLYINNPDEYNMSLVVARCVALLYHVVERGGLDQATLDRYAERYEALKASDPPKKNIWMSTKMREEVDSLFAYLDRQGVEIKPVSRKGQPNRRVPLMFAVFYAGEYVAKKGAEDES